MLALKKLEMEGFGPYAERQILEIPENGVTLVYGENMAGKTSLLNAVRYAFYGRVLGRGSRERRLHTLSNRELAANGQYGFKVSLTFEADGQPFGLVRKCVPTCEHPVDDGHYDQTVLLRKGASPLGPGQRDAVIARVLPDEISRFFLFDGELLQEYEKLLYDDDDDGQRISASIERILGVPILKRSRAHLSSLADKADAEAGKQASRDKNTKQLGIALKEATDRRQHHQNEIDRLSGDLEVLQQEKIEAENYIKSQGKYLIMLQELEAADARQKELESQIKAWKADLKTYMADAWRTLLGPTVSAARSKAAAEAAKAIDELVVKLRGEAAESGQCGVCLQTVAPSVREALAAGLPAGKARDHSQASATLVDLGRFVDRDVSEVVARLSDDLAKAEAEVATLKDTIKDKNMELADADVDRLKGGEKSFGDIIEKISVKKTAIDDHKDKLEQTAASIKNLNAKISKLAPTGLASSQARSRILRSATEVFQAAVEAYKLELRQRVEQTASELFLKMTTEKNDYAGLRITDAYGLHIVHKDSVLEVGRSAGAEHVVALALMGALQANAPIRGPIVMDSPFGRLDDGHTQNVIRALPDMAPQVVLLVHKAEVRQNKVREILGSKLVREYELKKQSSRRTTIEKVR